MNKISTTWNRSIKTLTTVALLSLLAGCATNKMPPRQHAELWGEPLPSFAKLDAVAIDKDAVFVFVSAPEGRMIASEQIALEEAVTQLTQGGVAIGIYELSADSDDYIEAQKEIETPCVLSFKKGAGMQIVSGEITVEALVGSLAGGSRGGCGPSGCGPSGCQ